MQDEKDLEQLSVANNRRVEGKLNDFGVAGVRIVHLLNGRIFYETAAIA
jgi:hypothetical protein